jgi:predicted DNA-binding ribbon-helix-helix protein
VYITGFGGRAMKPSPVVRHSITIDGQISSVSLEEAFWSALKDIAQERCESRQHLIASINAKRQSANLSSAFGYLFLSTTAISSIDEAE